MTAQAQRADDRWRGPGGPVEDAIVALAELVREAAAYLDDSDPAVARALRIRAAKLTVAGVSALTDLAR
jgi:hypothetical protein